MLHFYLFCYEKIKFSLEDMHTHHSHKIHVIEHTKQTQVECISIGSKTIK